MVPAIPPAQELAPGAAPLRAEETAPGAEAMADDAEPTAELTGPAAEDSGPAAVAAGPVAFGAPGPTGVEPLRNSAFRPVRYPVAI